MALKVWTTGEALPVERATEEGLLALTGWECAVLGEPSADDVAHDGV